MPKPALPFLHRHRTRHGKSVYYVKLTKREKGRGVRILAPIVRSEQFMMEYHAAVRGAPIAPTPAASKDGKGTLGWLIKQYRSLRDWCELLSAGTRKQRGPILQHLEETAGDIPLVSVKRTKVEDGMSARTQNQGRHLFDTMRHMFKWAVDNEHHDRNPTDGIKVNKDNGDGHLAWPIEMIEQYEARWPLGTRQRLMFDVYLYVGLRRGDAARLGKQHIRRGIVHLMTEKSRGKMPIYVPVHPALVASMKACPSAGWRSSPRMMLAQTTPRKDWAISSGKRSRRPASRSPRRDQNRRATRATAYARHRRPSPPRVVPPRPS